MNSIGNLLDEESGVLFWNNKIKSSSWRGYGEYFTISEMEHCKELSVMLKKVLKLIFQ